MADQGAATVDFALVLTPYSLDEVVVTATGEQAKREIGNAVSTVDASELVAHGADQQHGRPAGGAGAGVQVLPGQHHRRRQPGPHPG